MGTHILGNLHIVSSQTWEHPWYHATVFYDCSMCTIISSVRVRIRSNRASGWSLSGNSLPGINSWLDYNPATYKTLYKHDLTTIWHGRKWYTITHLYRYTPALLALLELTPSSTSPFFTVQFQVLPQDLRELLLKLDARQGLRLAGCGQSGTIGIPNMGRQCRSPGHPGSPKNGIPKKKPWSSP